MNAIPFDTHRVVKRLQQAGFSEPQAETVTDVLREAQHTAFDELATKADLLATKTALQADMAELRSNLESEISGLRAGMSALELKMHVEVGAVRADIARSQAETMKWLIGLLLVQGGLIVGLLRLLPAH